MTPQERAHGLAARAGAWPPRAPASRGARARSHGSPHRLWTDPLPFSPNLCSTAHAVFFLS